MQNRNSMATRQFEAENMQTENTDGLVSESLKMNRSTVCVKQGLKNFTAFKTAYKHANSTSNVSGSTQIQQNM